MKISKLQKALVLVTIASGALAVGCELIVDFDRTKIPAETVDASVPDAGHSDAIAPVVDAGPDAEPDAETPEDGGLDAEADADAD